MTEDMTGKTYRRTKAWHVYGYFDNRDTTVDVGEHPSFELANLAAGCWLKSQNKHAYKCEIVPVYEEREDGE